MTSSNDEIYKQLIDIRQTLYTQHLAVQEELADIKESIHDRFVPLEEKVTQHEHTFTMLTKVATWVFPSGMALGIIGWLTNLFNNTPPK